MNGLIKILFICIAIIVVGCDTAQNVERTFERHYVKYFGDEGNQSGADILVNADGTMLLLGNSIAIAGDRTSFLVKTDALGNVIWQRQIGNINDTGVDLEFIKRGPHTGNVIVAMNIGPESFSQIRLLKISTDGVGIDSAILPLHPSGLRQVVQSITPLESEDGYIITGYADNNFMIETIPVVGAEDQRDMMVLKVDESLTQVEKIVEKGGEKFGSGIKAFEFPGSSLEKFLLFGYSDRPYFDANFKSKFTYDIVNNGTPVGKSVGEPGRDEILSSVIKTSTLSGAGYLMVGTSRAGTGGELYLVKFNSALEFQSFGRRLNLGKNLECVGAANADNGGYYILANELVPGDFSDIMLVHVGFDGTEQWIQSFGTRGADDRGGAITTLPDGRIAIVATMELKTKKKLALMVLNRNGGF